MHDAQVAQQIRDDAAEARRLQDIFDLLGPGQQSGEISPTTGPFEPPSPSTNVWGPGYLALCWMLLTVFRFSNGYATNQLLLGFDALRSQLPVLVYNTVATAP